MLNAWKSSLLALKRCGNGGKWCKSCWVLEIYISKNWAFHLVVQMLSHRRWGRESNCRRLIWRDCETRKWKKDLLLVFWGWNFNACREFKVLCFVCWGLSWCWDLFTLLFNSEMFVYGNFRKLDVIKSLWKILLCRFGRTISICSELNSLASRNYKFLSILFLVF